MRSLFVILCILSVFLNVSVNCLEGTFCSLNISSAFCLRDFILTITPKYGIVIERNKFILFKTHENRPFIAVGYAFHQEKLGNHRGNFNIKEWMLFQTSYQTITSATQPSQNEIVIIGEVFGSVSRASYSLRFFIPERVSNTNSKPSASYLTKQIAFDLHVRAERGKFNRIFLNYWCDLQEKFYGFGVQYSVWNMKGRRIPIVVSEQGIGRGTEPITTFLNLFADGAGGDWSTTYAPKPYYLTNLNRSIILENSEVKANKIVMIPVNLIFRSLSSICVKMIPLSSRSGAIV